VRRAAVLGGGLALVCLLIWLALRSTGRAGPSAALRRRSLLHGGMARRYLLRLPPGYTPNEPRPLVIALHWAGGSGDEMSRYSDINRRADRSGWIVAYPDASGESPSWNAGHCCGDAPERGVDDVGFIEALIDELTATRAVDPARVYVTGMSNGGMLAHRVGAALADRVAAIAPVAASIGGQPASDGPVVLPPAPTRPVPAIIFHGLRDTLVPYHGGRGEATTGDRRDLSAVESAAFWARHNGCDPKPRRHALAGGAVLRDEYAACAAGADVVLYSLVDGGHDWPGSKHRWWRPAPHGLIATDLIWEFFARRARA
jgi:polyhydroxybutyrate depolymerase